MNRLVCQSLYFRAGLVSVALAVQQGCQENPPIESWDSSRMLVIEKEWDALDKSFSTQSKDEYARHLKKLDAIFRQHLSSRDLRRLVETCGSLPVRAKDRSSFANAVLKYMTETYLLAGDRDNLVKLLTTRFPDQIFWEKPIEYAVVTGYGSDRLKAPILMFGEAYSKCQDAEVRHHLAIVVRRAFIGSGIRGKDDSEFVKSAMQWYEKEKDHLTVADNSYFLMASYDDSPAVYGKDRESRGSNSPWARFGSHPLFVEKSSVPERKKEE